MGSERVKTVGRIKFRWKLLYRSVGKKYTLNLHDDYERLEFLVSRGSGFKDAFVYRFPEDGENIIKVKARHTWPSSAVFARRRRLADLPEGTPNLNSQYHIKRGFDVAFTIRSGSFNAWDRV